MSIVFTCPKSQIKPKAILSRRKGQLISKAILQAVDSPKMRTDEFPFFDLKVVAYLSQPFAFEINRPLDTPKKRTDEFVWFPVKQKNKQNRSFVCFLEESRARQSAFGFI